MEPTEFQVALEGAVYTLVDVHAGQEEAFEQWYERDHFYAGGVLAPYVLSGRRWYAGKDLRKTRFVAPDCPLPDPHAGTNLALYWLTTGGLDGFFTWIAPVIRALAADGRMFTGRTHVNTEGYRLERVLDTPRGSQVPPHVALDHPFGGVFVSYLLPADTGGTAATAELPDGSLTITFRPNASVAVDTGGSAAPSPGPALPTFPSAAGPVRLALTFLPSAPAADVEATFALVSAVAAATSSRPLWGGGFGSVVAGSTAHLG